MSNLQLCRNTKIYSFYRNTNSQVAGRKVNSKILSMGKKMDLSSNQENSGVKGSAGISFLSSIFILVSIMISGGAFYLYQVNDMATKGFEIRDLENKIQDLEKEKRKMEIREVELRSMYNIEKSTEDLNLVNPPNTSYLEINGPVAMK